MIASWLPLRRLWPLLVIAAAFIGPASNPIGLPDIWWTLQSGAWMIDHHALLVADPFTSAPVVSGPIYNVQWLAELAYYGLFRVGGLEMVILGTALAIAVTYALVLASAVIASGRLRLASLSVALAYLLGFSNLSPRPQTLAYPLFAIFLLAVTRAEWRRDNRLLWLLPALTIVWANVHGSFFAGWLLLACAAGGRVLTERSLRTARAYALALVGCILAAACTPYGPGSIAYLAGMGSNPIIRDLVTEWAPTSIASREGGLFFVSAGVVLVVALRSRARLTWTEVLLLLAFGYLAISSIRAIVWWGLVIAPTATRLLGSLARSRPARPVPPEKPVLNVAIVLAIIGMVGASLPWFKASMPILPEDKRVLVAADTPVGVADYLRTHDLPAGRMFNHQGWGGYFDWAVWPAKQPFLDGRIELHAPQTWMDYLTVSYPGDEWQSVLDQYGVSSLVLDRGAEADLIARVEATQGWQQTYEDDQAVVFVRA